MPPIVIGPLSAAWLVVASAGLGRLVLRVVRVRESGFAERAVIGTTLGLGVLQSVPFALFATGLGTSAAFRLAAASLLIPGVAALLALRGSVGKARACLGRTGLWDRAVIGLFVILGAAVFVRAVCPIVDGDGLAYHLTASMRWLDAGRFVYIPTIAYTNWPMGSEALVAMLIGIHHQAPPGVVQYVFGCLSVSSCFLIGRRVRGAPAGVLACVLLLGFCRYWEQFASMHVELAIAAYATALCLVLTVDVRAGVAAGVLAGLAASTKLSGMWLIPTAALVAGARPGMLPVEGRRVRAAVLTSGILVVAPWLARCWALTGNPVYPMLYSVFGGLEWSTRASERFYRAHRLWCLLPGFATSDAGILHSHIALAAIGVIVAATAWHASRKSPLALPVRLAAFHAAALAVSGYVNSRFLIPALPCLAVAVAASVGRSVRVRPALVFALMVPLAVHSGTRAMWPDWATAYRTAVGTMSRAAWQRRHLSDYAAVEFVNSRLGRDVRVLVATREKFTALYEAAALWPDAMLQDSVRYGNVDQFDNDLRRLGITHVVYAPDFGEECPNNLACAARLRVEPSTQGQLLRQRGRALFTANGHTVYALESAAPRNGADRGVGSTRTVVRARTATRVPVTADAPQRSAQAALPPSSHRYRPGASSGSRQ